MTIAQAGASAWRRLSVERQVKVVSIVVLCAALVLLGYGWLNISRPVPWGEVAFWILLVQTAELLPVPAWRSLSVSVSFPLLMAVAIRQEAAVAASIAVVATFEPREFRRQIDLARAVFNHAQIGLAVMAASATFRAVSDGESIALQLLAAFLAVIADYLVNSLLVATMASVLYQVPAASVVRRLRIGNAAEFVISYIGLGLLGLLLDALYEIPNLGPWAVGAFLMPLLFARQMFFRSRALEEATAVLKDRDRMLRALSNRMAEERQDERLQIAGYLHDDLAQLLYRLSLGVDLSKKKLDAHDLEGVAAALDSIKETKNRSVEIVRALIRDLHRSPLGPAGLEQALRSFMDDLARESSTRFVATVRATDLPPPIQLLIYQIAREAVMNAFKHAEASVISVSVLPMDDGAELVIADDGKGFDAEQGEPEGHFGLTMMRERCLVAGGKFSIKSAPGRGSEIRATFPISWLSDDTPGASDGHAAAVREPAVDGR